MTRRTIAALLLALFAAIPWSAAGSRPKADSAEKRPPTLATPGTQARKPRLRAVVSRLEPASVMAMKRAPASRR